MRRLLDALARLLHVLPLGAVDQRAAVRAAEIEVLRREITLIERETRR